MKGMGTIKVAFRIFDIPPKNLHTHNINNTHRCFCHIILLNILWKCSNTYHWGLILFYDLGNYTELYEIDWRIIWSQSFHLSVGSHFVLTFTWHPGERFEIGALLSILINNWYVPRQKSRSKVRFWNTAVMWKYWPNTLDRMWRENWVGNGGLK
jgi:hypothetical protein